MCVSRMGLGFVGATSAPTTAAAVAVTALATAAPAPAYVRRVSVPAVPAPARPHAAAAGRLCAVTRDSRRRAALGPLAAEGSEGSSSENAVKVSNLALEEERALRGGGLTGGAEGVAGLPDFDVPKNERELWWESAVRVAQKNADDLATDSVLVPYVHSARGKMIDSMFPGRKEEMWRYTDMRALLAMRPETNSAGRSLSASDAERFQDADVNLVVVDGRFVSNLSTGLDLLAKGVYFGSISDAPKAIKERAVELLLQRKQSSKVSAFEWLQAVSSPDALVLHVPNRVQVPNAVHILCAASSQSSAASMCSPSIVVCLEQDASLVVTESHLLLDGDDSNGSSSVFVNSLCVAALASNASLAHALVSELPEGKGAHLGVCAAKLAQGAQYMCTTINAGGSLSRWDVSVDLDEKEAYGEVHGLCFAEQTAVMDLHSEINHNVPHCKSEQLQKNVALDKAKSVFRGMIYVAPHASQTDSEQMCRSLLLSSNARVDIMPSLIIYNEDVKATHGATVSDLSDEELFYLQSRGLSPEDSRLLLLKGFTGEIVQRIPLKGVQERLERKFAGVVDRIKSRKRGEATFSSI